MFIALHLIRVQHLSTLECVLAFELIQLVQLKSYMLHLYYVESMRANYGRSTVKKGSQS